MAETVTRCELSSGGWWDLIARPQWKHVRRWTDWHERLGDDCQLAMCALAALTPAWSFDEAIDPRSVRRRSEEDLCLALRAFLDGPMARLGKNADIQPAEDLFEGLLIGKIPESFVEVHLMTMTGWSWQTLQETPADVVQRMSIYLAVRQARDRGGSVVYVENEHVA